MHNPLEDPVPDGVIPRVHAFAKDLAYGAAEGLWDSRFSVGYGDNSESLHSHGGFDPVMLFLLRKWEHQQPSISYLISLEYVNHFENNSGYEAYILTPKVFALLEQVAPASVFISYRRSQSSAFALLILARMKAVGLTPFLDMQDLAPGDEWHARLQDEIAQRDYCLVLISCDTLKSEYVRQEIQWALNAQKTVIPVWHGGMNGDSAQEAQEQYPELVPFFTKQAIIVEPESPAGYESAIVQLLNRFGYTP